MTGQAILKAILMANAIRGNWRRIEINRVEASGKRSRRLWKGNCKRISCLSCAEQAGYEFASNISRV